MYDFGITGPGTIEFKVDLAIYSDSVISRVLYWLTADFIVERKEIPPQCQQINLMLKHNADLMTKSEALKYRAEIAQMFSDFKVREIVRKETDGIRNILYLKAFANCSDLEDLRGSE